MRAGPSTGTSAARLERGIRVVQYHSSRTPYIQHTRSGYDVTAPTEGAVRTVGTETLRVSQPFVDEMVTVTTDQLCAAIKHGFNDTRCVLEPAGALGIAGMLKYCSDNGWEEKNVYAFLFGGVFIIMFMR